VAVAVQQTLLVLLAVTAVVVQVACRVWQAQQTQVAAAVAVLIVAQAQTAVQAGAE
jgi:hypothetical protein